MRCPAPLACLSGLFIPRLRHLDFPDDSDHFPKLQGPGGDGLQAGGEEGNTPTPSHGMSHGGGPVPFPRSSREGAVASWGLDMGLVPTPRWQHRKPEPLRHPARAPGGRGRSGRPPTPHTGRMEPPAAIATGRCKALGSPLRPQEGLIRHGTGPPSIPIPIPMILGAGSAGWQRAGKQKPLQPRGDGRCSPQQLAACGEQTGTPPHRHPGAEPPREGLPFTTTSMSPSPTGPASAWPRVPEPRRLDGAGNKDAPNFRLPSTMPPPASKDSGRHPHGR